MVFRTANSTYEVDETKKAVRRLYGKDEPTPRQGKDGDWKSYDEISPVTVGEPVLIVWDSSEGRTTFTSPVRELNGAAAN